MCVAQHNTCVIVVACFSGDDGNGGGGDCGRPGGGGRSCREAGGNAHAHGHGGCSGDGSGDIDSGSSVATSIARMWRERRRRTLVFRAASVCAEVSCVAPIFERASKMRISQQKSGFFPQSTIPKVNWGLGEGRGGVVRCTSCRRGRATRKGGTQSVNQGRQGYLRT